ncbi:MAG: hypothetical protein K8I29_01690 [Alphaproteobacteria bacterium]|uniref:Uncharacterized protein n=1 Tax=Candidatus Nitrobium versatile TaxID=2884831 RepID=A0A953JBP0_9BACT|nr:hypothetical protein [Candidatus Nitrobium versatile]
MKKKRFVRHYVTTKREKAGPCNICKTHTELTWDHVPPKGGIDLTAVEMEKVSELFVVGHDEIKFSESQNGVKYRTVCKSCNETIGHRYDPALNEFSLTVGRYLKSGLSFPRVVHHRAKPAAMIRAILGHLAAAKIEIDDCPFDRNVREFVLDEDKPIPDDIFIFYWLYPYEQSITMRDFAMPTVRGNFSTGIGFCQVLKYFPIAYLVINKPAYEGLEELTRYRNLSVDEEVEIPILLDRVEHAHWPEIVDDYNIVLASKTTGNAILAKPKRKKR